MRWKWEFTLYKLKLQIVRPNGLYISTLKILHCFYWYFSSLDEHPRLFKLFRFWYCWIFMFVLGFMLTAIDCIWLNGRFKNFLIACGGAFAYRSNRFCSVMTYSRNLKQNRAHSIQHESFSFNRGYWKSTKNNRQSKKKF